MSGKARSVGGIRCQLICACALLINTAPDRLLTVPEKGTQAPPIAEPDSCAPLSGERAWQTMDSLARVGSRAVGKPGRSAARAIISEQLAQQGWRVTLDDFDVMHQDRVIALQNVMAHSDHAEPTSILLGGHYDGPPFDYPAVNDGPSGVAVLLEVARRLRCSPATRDRRDLAVVLFDGEEPISAADRGTPLLGSRRVAAKIRSEGLAARLRAVLVVDLVAERELHLNSDEHAPKWLQRMAQLAAVEAGHHNVWDGPPASITNDHLPFSELGVPALLIGDFQYGPVQKGGNPLGAFHHSEQDRLDKLSPDSLLATAEVVFTLVENLLASQ
ncbi:M28 family metallopeptidase [Luteitalea sp.]